MTKHDSIAKSVDTVSNNDNQYIKK